MAIKEYIENRFTKFQTGWNISVDYTEETKVVCSKWAGFAYPKSTSSMTVNHYSSDNCVKFACEETENAGKCCSCVN